MTTYYVKASGDNTTGLSTATAKTTISGGALLAVAGDTVTILAGDYDGGLYFSSATYDAGTTASPITMVSSPRYAARIVALGAPPAGGGNDAMLDVRANGWVIDGFEITAEDGYDGSNNWTLGGSGQYRIGIYLGGKNQKAQNNWIHHTCQGDPGGSGGAGITSDGYYVSYASQNNYVRWNHIHNTASSLTGNSSHGVYVAGADTHVQGNLVYNMFNGVLIHGWHGMTGGSYSNNTVFNSTNAGLLIGQGDGGAGSGTANFRGFNNSIQNCNVGIDEQGLITTPRNIWSNNHCYNCTTDYAINSTSTAVNKISGDPLMINYVSTGGGNYHLSVGSSLINAGISSLSGVDATTLDLDGTTRPVSSTYDIGAYEFVASGDSTGATLSGAYVSLTAVTTVTCGIVTDEGNQIIYCLPSTTSVSADTIIANGRSMSITVVGTKSFALTGLSAATTYRCYWTQIDAAGNTATVVSSPQFITSAAPVSNVLYNNSAKSTNTATANLVCSMAITTGATLVVAIGTSPATSMSAVAANGVALTQLGQTIHTSANLAIALWGTTASPSGAAISISARTVAAATPQMMMIAASYYPDNGGTVQFGGMKSATASAVANLTFFISTGSANRVVFAGIGNNLYSLQGITTRQTDAAHKVIKLADSAGSGTSMQFSVSATVTVQNMAFLGINLRT